MIEALALSFTLAVFSVVLLTALAATLFFSTAFIVLWTKEQ